VARDAARRAATFPGADVLLSAAHSPAGPIDTSPCGSASDGVHPPAGPPGATFAVRLGMADQAAHLAPVPADDGGFTAPLVRGLPVALPVDVGSTTISGTAGSVRLLLNFVLMQLDAAGVPVVLQGQVPGLPLCARFLPRTVLAATDSDAVAAIGASSPPVTGPLSRGVFTPDGAPAESPATATPCVLVTVNSPPAGARSAFPGVRCLHFSTFGQEAVPADSTAAVVLRPRGDGISGVTGTVEFVPDGVQDLLFDRYCRARARHISGQRALPHFAPSTVPLPEGATPAAVARRWSSTANGPLAPVPIGSSDTGAELFDFSHDGPHLLVGGTTGSGKSEFLRTLVGSLAAAHSPADLQFVLIDFKGGAGLGPLHRFPHTTSLVTDLGGHSMARTLASLRAEIHRRERALGHAGASDCDQYRAGFAGSALTERAGMAHLVVVVDEFRVLVDQFPDAMAELMQIAAVGRSLGIHLVMATQRPQGAINADIRANVTSAVCLRVQTTFDSQDVIGSGVAAAIGVDLPGRAFISRAGARPTQFQSATLCLPGREDGEHPRADLVADLLSHTSVGKVLHPQGPAHRAVRVPGSGTDRLGEFGERTNSSVAAVAGLLASAWRDVAGTAARAV
ncbi:MAG: FtsK/SpoIIIE domain-containing protein, partial [Specibacter sp.]